MSITFTFTATWRRRKSNWVKNVLAISTWRGVPIKVMAFNRSSVSTDSPLSSRAPSPCFAPSGRISTLFSSTTLRSTPSPVTVRLTILTTL